ncbi:fumarylacetoacetate hydrolase family protein [uncultured Oscillibacter sp.]|jgi:2-keto-4-pentenoate hydratase/2-oxohepta-3-ene-1,7-dioic acid hydratase in catechol pathway|uniref:fumarylacetoacetate hydrolase family protein n=1 Tax=uncultured Oscillibacter sp. TaxID=876091 RepID=UPI0021714735|nr:fumarylacetoacetate hydrolase family protein [uncultured Oscillibacter sp.]MCI9554977.1 fumarylacetoacetate hydrolase family protein [Oscillibacter sp.]
MKLITCLYKGEERVGKLTEAGVAFLPYPDMNALIEAGDLTAPAGRPVPLEEVRLLAPIPRPRQDVICLGMNYRDHEKEAAKYDADAFTKDKPAAVYFSKRVSRAGDPDGVIPRYEGLVERLDYEAELAVIIGKTAKNVKAEEAGEYIFGYTVLNDVSARDLQTGHKQWYFGKSLDGFTPLGPCILTADETAFPPALDISCAVNGEERQRSNTALLIHSIAGVIEELSAGMTLLPGTIIATGTPAGVGMGFDPPKFLKSGDVVECTIQNIGTLKSTVR